MKINLLNKILLGVSLFACGSASAQSVAPLKVGDAYGTTFYGSLMYAQGWSSMVNPPYGIYSFPMQLDADVTGVKVGGEYVANGGAVYVDGKYYMIGYTTDPDGGYINGISYRVYDVDGGWQLLQEKSLEGRKSIPTDLAYDPYTDRVYGCFYTDGDDFNFGELNLLTGEKDVYGVLSEQLIALAASRDGIIYGIGGTSGKLYRVEVIPDVKKFTLYEIGSTGLNVRYAQSAAFDYATGKLYWAATMHDFSSPGGLYEVNTSTGSVNKVAGFPVNYEFTGLYTLARRANDAAPGEITNLSLNFPDGALNGSVSFTIPSTTASGDALSGSVHYNINIDDNSSLLLEGDANAGQTVTVPCSFSEAAVRMLRVSTTNTAGRSPVSVTYSWIGTDIAEAVNPVLSKTDAALTIAWTAPEKGVNGGYINTNGLSYKVIRQPEGVEIYSGTATTCTDEATSAGMEYRWYDVVAYVDGKEGKAASTNRLLLGDAFETPYSENFSDMSAFDLYTFIDGNDDGNQWNRAEGCAIYQYDEYHSADDWLITPPLALDPAFVYELSFRSYSEEADYPEKLRVMAGNEPTITGMTTEIVPKFSVAWDRYQQTSAVVRPMSSEPTYIGFQACSDADNYYLYLTGIKVDKLASVEAPDTVTSLKATAASEGVLTATVTFNLPEKKIDGTALSSVTKAEVFRGSTLVKTFDSGLSAGAACSFTDNVSRSGSYTYSVVAYNDKGVGLKHSTDVYVGEDVPNAVENIKASSTSDGKVSLSWSAPSTGKNGGFVNKENLTYTLTRTIGLSTNTFQTTETSYTDNVETTEDLQKLVWYEIAASSQMGVSEKANTDTLFVGKPYALPYSESFASMRLERGPWNVVTDGVARWSVVGVASVDPQDFDGGSIVFSPQMQGGKGELISPKISLQGSTNPILTFHVWHQKTAHNKLQVVLRTEKGEEHLLNSIVQGEMNNPEATGEWVEYTVPLAQYSSDAYGEAYIQLLFRAENELIDYTTFNALYLDNIDIKSIYDYDLQAGNIAGGTSVAVGETIEFLTDVTNVGARTAEDYTVELYRNGVKVDEAEGEPTEPNEVRHYTLKDTPNSDAPETSRYHVVINYPADMKTDNNTTAETVVTILPGLPFVDNLKGELKSDGTALLTWDAPYTGSPAKVSEQTTEDFETYAAFTITNLGKWTLYDGDGLPTSGLINESTGDYYQYDNVEKPMAYQVFNPSQIGITGSLYAPHSGSQMLISFISMGGSRASDDWLISPLVDGAQEISFWAKAPDCTYFGTSESVEVLYSTTGTNIDDFQKIGNTITINSESWREQRVTLPEGTKYFAIRKTSVDQYILCIDDITYRPQSDEVVLQGYNVYRDGEKITATPITETRYEVQASPSEQSYQVSVVYDRGESILSNVVVISPTSGIGDVRADVRIAGGKGQIAVSGADGKRVTVRGLSGNMLYNGTGNATVQLPSGVYIVTVDRHNVKIVVR